MLFLFLIIRLISASFTIIRGLGHGYPPLRLVAVGGVSGTGVAATHELRTVGTVLWKGDIVLVVLKLYIKMPNLIWMSNKIEICLKNIVGYDLVLSDCTLIDENDEVIGSSFFDKNNSKSGFLKNLIKNSYLGCCMVINRSILDKFFKIYILIIPFIAFLFVIAPYFYKILFPEYTDSVFFFRSSGRKGETYYRLNPLPSESGKQSVI